MNRSLFVITFLSSVVASAQYVCPTNNPRAVIEEVSRKVIAQSKAVAESRGLMVFSDESNKTDSIYRIASQKKGISFTFQNGAPLTNPSSLKITGATQEVKNDLTKTSADREALELSLKNYTMTFIGTDPKNGSILIYELSPRGDYVGRFKSSSLLYIDGNSCLPVSVTGEINSGHSTGVLKINILTKFEIVMGLYLPTYTDVRSLILSFKHYHMWVNTHYDLQDIVLNHGSETTFENAHFPN